MFFIPYIERYYRTVKSTEALSTGRTFGDATTYSDKSITCKRNYIPENGRKGDSKNKAQVEWLLCFNELRHTFVYSDRRENQW